MCVNNFKYGKSVFHNNVQNKNISQFETSFGVRMLSVSDQINKSDMSSLLSSQFKEPPINITSQCPIYDFCDQALDNEITQKINGMCMYFTTSVSSIVWHCRLGHPSPQTSPQILNTGIKYSDKFKKIPGMYCV